MAKRLDDVAQTRQRIVDATVELHGTLGPARTTVAAIADRAGVTRATVYSHFPDLETLFGACSASWFSRQPVVPDPAAWQAIPDAEQRLRTGLAQLYAFFRTGASMLTLIYADWESIPQGYRSVVAARNDATRDVLVAAFAHPTKRLRALIGHAAAFSTWRSLCLDQGLSDRDAVDAMTVLVLGAGRRLSA